MASIDQKLLVQLIDAQVEAHAKCVKTAMKKLLETPAHQHADLEIEAPPGYILSGTLPEIGKSLPVSEAEFRGLVDTVVKFAEVHAARDFDALGPLIEQAVTLPSVEALKTVCVAEGVPRFEAHETYNEKQLKMIEKRFEAERQAVLADLREKAEVVLGVAEQ